MTFHLLKTKRPASFIQVWLLPISFQVQHNTYTSFLKVSLPVASSCDLSPWACHLLFTHV